MRGREHVALLALNGYSALAALAAAAAAAVRAGRRAWSQGIDSKGDRPDVLRSPARAAIQHSSREVGSGQVETSYSGNRQAAPNGVPSSI